MHGSATKADQPESPDNSFKSPRHRHVTEHDTADLCLSQMSFEQRWTQLRQCLRVGNHQRDAIVQR